MRVLIVDDEEHILRDLGDALRDSNCVVSAASTIEKAQSFISKNKYDYIVIDLNLDVRSSFGGIEVYKYSRLHNMKPIILSGYSFEQVEEQLKTAIGPDEDDALLAEISANYIYKGGELSYIEAVLKKLGIEQAEVLDWYGNYHACLMAVQNYKHGISSLQYPFQDTEKLRKILVAHYNFPGENIQILRDPSRRDIISKLCQYSNELTSEDNLLIFYAGHGNWDGCREQGYWLPSDAEINNPSNWISNADVRDLIRAIKTQHTLVISDACFSGAILRTRSASIGSKTIQEKYLIKSRRVLASGSPSQAVPDRSMFLDYLVKRLKENSTPYLYAEKLYTGICDEFVQLNLSAQNPVYGVIQFAGDEVGGDFIFVKE